MIAGFDGFGLRSRPTSGNRVPPFNLRCPVTLW